MKLGFEVKCETFYVCGVDVYLFVAVTCICVHADSCQLFDVCFSHGQGQVPWVTHCPQPSASVVQNRCTTLNRSDAQH